MSEIQKYEPTLELIDGTDDEFQAVMAECEEGMWLREDDLALYVEQKVNETIADKHKQYEIVVRNDDKEAFISLLCGHLEQFPEVFERKVKEQTRDKHRILDEYEKQAQKLRQQLAAANEQIEQLRCDLSDEQGANGILKELNAEQAEEIEGFKARVGTLEDMVREALSDAEAEWEQVKNHPASRFARDVQMYREALNPQQETPQ